MEYRICLLDFFHPPLYLLLLPLPLLTLSHSPELRLALRQSGFLPSSHPRLIIKLSRQQQHGMNPSSSRLILIYASPFTFHLHSSTTPSHVLLTSAATKISKRATRQVLIFIKGWSTSSFFVRTYTPQRGSGLNSRYVRMLIL